MKHRRLFDLRVRHGFFADGGCPDLAIEPSARHPGGARALARHRLLALPRPDGLEVLAEVGGDGDPTIALTDLSLRFDLRVSGPDFAHYTDSSAWQDLLGPTWGGSSADGGPLVLGAGAGDHPPDVVAAVVVSGLSAAWLAAPPRFFLDLKAREALWVYYLLTTRPNGQPPAIRDGELARALGFARVQLSPDNAAAADDPVGHRLLARYPERRCFRMISDRPIACRRAPVRQLALYLGEELLLRELSNPSIHSHATLRVEPNAEPRPSLFRVIEY